MKAPLVSIIVPVYNTEQYVSECIASILRQSFADFELILVNDGSTDNSLYICQYWIGKDSRIRLIDILNKGVGNARNKGLEAAQGKWITFIDSDDYVCPNYLQQMIEVCQNGVDFVQSGIIFFDNMTKREIGRETLTDGLYLNRKNPKQCFLMATMPLITSPVSKLYRRELLEIHNIRFDTRITVGEDRDFNLAYLNVITRSCSIDYAGYYYRKGIIGNLSSNMNYMQLLKWDIEYCHKLSSFFCTNGCDAAVTEKYLAHRVFYIYNDRFVQLVNAQRHSVIHLSRILRGIVSQEEYIWLCKHLELVDCKQITALIYRSRSPLLVSIYLKMLSHING